MTAAMRDRPRAEGGGDGAMWPTSYRMTELTDADETRIAALVKKAVG